MEVDDEEGGAPDEEGITWREFALVFVATLLLDMERSPKGLSSYRKTNVTIMPQIVFLSY